MRTRPWVLHIRIEPDEVEDLKAAHADFFGGDVRRVTREDIEQWAEGILRSELEVLVSETREESDQ